MRYLPSGVDVGSPKQYLTVATYPFPGTYAVIRKQARVKGAVTARLAGGGVAVLDAGYPQSVHVGYPHVDYQIEVYDPTPARAMQLVSSGQLASIGSPAATTAGRISTKPTAATRADLQTFAQRVGHPIYWAGPKPGYTYELSTTSNGSVFIRYLPAGVRVGDARAQLPDGGDVPVSRRLRGGRRGPRTPARPRSSSRAAGSASSTPRYPKSIHLAYPGSDYQIEVYDPSPSAGRKLVASGAISPVPVAQGRPGADLAAGLDRLSARPRAALARLRPAGRAGVWTRVCRGPLLLPLGLALLIVEANLVTMRGATAQLAAPLAIALAIAGLRAPHQTPAARHVGRSESRSRSSPSTPPRSSSPGRPRSPATSRSTTPRPGWRSPIG